MLYLYEDYIISKLINYGKKDENLHQIMIYGSYARNEHRPESDIDFLIVTDNISESEKIFSEFRNEIFIETSVMTSFYYVTPVEFSYSKELLLKRIQREGKIIWSKKKKI